MPQEQYIDDFLGSYEELEIIEDNAPDSSDDYEEDNYAQLDNGDIIDEDEEQFRETELRQSEQQKEDVEEMNKGISNKDFEDTKLADDNANELRGQGMKMKIDVDDDSTIPDMRINK